LPSGWLGFVHPTRSQDLYSPREIALAAGVPAADVVAALGDTRGLVPHAEAVRLGRALVARAASSPPGAVWRPGSVLFAMFSGGAPSRRPAGVPLAVSSTLHVGMIAIAVLIATLNLSPRAATLRAEDPPADLMRLVFVATPGPGGGGGGGGLMQKAPAPEALREGRHTIRNPLPERREPRPLAPVAAPPEPKPEPVLKAEPLPAVIAPIVPASADPRNRIGVLQQSRAENDSHGPGAGGGVGTGKGTGLGEGDGSGLGSGSGGGVGGGPYRPGSGVEPPRLLREVKADYTEEARQRGIVGDVVLEIVVRVDGSVGDVKILQGLAGGLNDRAVQAVRQWRFSPARRLGAAVDVIVEVAVEFKLR
jgi:periplasmic protein TonB